MSGDAEAQKAWEAMTGKPAEADDAPELAAALNAKVDRLIAKRDAVTAPDVDREAIRARLANQHHTEWTAVADIAALLAALDECEAQRDGQQKISTKLAEKVMALTAQWVAVPSHRPEDCSDSRCPLCIMVSHYLDRSGEDDTLNKVQGWIDDNADPDPSSRLGRIAADLQRILDGDA